MKKIPVPMVLKLMSGAMIVGSLSSCTSLQPKHAVQDRAFIAYWPPPQGSTKLRLAVKDLIDIKGTVTSAGSEYVLKNSAPAKRDAACLAIARERNVDIVGKTNLTEFAVTVSGKNDYFGTPVNRWDGEDAYIPGGSSSGSAVAVSTGRADVAFGTDTGGSIRVPAAFCGVYGLKTTFGLVPTKGVFPISGKYLDTVGPMAADMPRLVEGMDLLQRGFKGRYQAAVAAKPSGRQIKVGRLYIGGTDPDIDKAIDEQLAAKGFKVVKLDSNFRDKWIQADADGETVALSDAWLNDQKYAGKPGVGRTTTVVIAKGALDRLTGLNAALGRRAAWQRDLRRVFTKVDFIVTPTLQILPPKKPWWVTTAVFEKIVFDAQNTVGVNFAGNPALAVPVALPPREDFTPLTSLQLIGPRNSEAQLLNAGRLLQLKR